MNTLLRLISNMFVYLFKPVGSKPKKEKTCEARMLYEQILEDAKNDNVYRQPILIKPHAKNKRKVYAKIGRGGYRVFKVRDHVPGLGTAVLKGDKIALRRLHSKSIIFVPRERFSAIWRNQKFDPATVAAKAA